MTQEFNINPVSFITVNTIGDPGNRVFYLQAGRGDELVTLTIEKEHALALVSSLDELTADLDARFPRPSSHQDHKARFSLRQPVDPLFRVGQMGLGYDEQADMIVLIAYQLVLDEGEDPSVVRFWVSREQIQTLRDHALLAVEGGRPTCELCGELIGPEGHLCPRRNGHGNDPKFAD
jgi:uncharacterized repeat protein (TIGR03847 family)